MQKAYVDGKDHTFLSLGDCPHMQIRGATTSTVYSISASARFHSLACFQFRIELIEASSFTIMKGCVLGPPSASRYQSGMGPLKVLSHLRLGTSYARDYFGAPTFMPFPFKTQVGGPPIGENGFTLERGEAWARMGATTWLA